MIGAIFLNGKINAYEAIKHYCERIDFYIGVDGGVKHLQNLNIVPDLLIGDFDSIEDLNTFGTIEKITLDSDKDFTDGERAVNYVIENNFDKVYIFGAIGGRFDHVLSNIFILDKLLEAAIQGIVVDEKNIIYLIDHKINIQPDGMDYFSIIPLTEKITNVQIIGARYEVHGETFHRASSYGVSNEFIDQEVTISFDQGKALVIKSKD